MCNELSSCFDFNDKSDILTVNDVYPFPLTLLLVIYDSYVQCHNIFVY